MQFWYGLRYKGEWWFLHHSHLHWKTYINDDSVIFVGICTKKGCFFPKVCNVVGTTKPLKKCTPHTHTHGQTQNTSDMTLWTEPWKTCLRCPPLLTVSKGVQQCDRGGLTLCKCPLILNCPPQPARVAEQLSSMTADSASISDVSGNHTVWMWKMILSQRWLWVLTPRLAKYTDSLKSNT